MPFTFAHPAIVLPFNYCRPKYVSLTALVAGSMAPDFEYFLRMKTLGLHGHTLSGWFYFDMPLALILAFLFHQVVRNPLIHNLPSFLYHRLQVYCTFDWKMRFRKHWFIIILSALAGTGSHLLWDSFTHEKRFFVQHIPALSSVVPYLHIHVYTLLQHGSTVVGFCVIGWALKQLPAGPLHDKQYSNRYYWPAVIALTGLVTAVRLWIHWVSYIGDIVATVIGAGLWALLMVSCFRISGSTNVSHKKSLPVKEGI